MGIDCIIGESYCSEQMKSVFSVFVMPKFSEYLKVDVSYKNRESVQLNRDAYRIESGVSMLNPNYESITFLKKWLGCASVVAAGRADSGCQPVPGGDGDGGQREDRLYRHVQGVPHHHTDTV